MRVSSGTGKQFIYDDKQMVAVIEPLADGTWRAVKSGKLIAFTIRVPKPSPRLATSGGHHDCRPQVR
jgi:hypothetical protein